MAQSLTAHRPGASQRTRPAARPDQTDPARPSSYLVIVAVVVVANLLGLVMVLSASSVSALHTEGNPYHYFARHLLWLGVAGVAFIVTLRTDYQRWRRLSAPLLLGAVALLVVVLMPGVGNSANGSQRWIGAGGFTLQPSEFAKLAILLYAADLLARRWRQVGDNRLTLYPVVLVFAGIALLIMKQPNLGTTIVIAAITFSVLFAAGVPMRSLSGLAALGTAVAAALSLGVGYRRARLLAFLDPWADPLNTGYQTIQSQVSLASGGWFGVGLGASRAKWGYLPYAHTDFIFAIIGEELGLFGALFVVALFVLFGFAGVMAAVHAPDPFGRMLAIGITAWFCVQAFVNIGAVIGVLPITGVPLPFLSFGGSALLASMAAAGILANIALQGGDRRRNPGTRRSPYRR